MLLILAWRNLWRNKRRTLITVSSVLFAVLLASGLLSFAGGFQQQLRESMIRQETGYLQIQDVDYMDEPSLDHSFLLDDELKEVLAFFGEEMAYYVPRIRGFALAARDMSSRPVMVSGIVPEQEDRLRRLSGDVTAGKMFGAGDRHAVVASGLAQLLDLEMGDSIALIGQGFQGVTAAGMYPVEGIIEFILPETNNTMVFLPLEQAQHFFAAEGRLTNLIIMVEDERVIQPLARKMAERLDNEWLRVRTWDELMPDILGLISMQNTVYTGITWVFYLIVGFGIFGTMLMMVYERMHEYGILLSLGMKRRQLALVSMAETIFIGLLGALAGIVASFPLVLIFHHHPLRFKGEMANYIMDFGMEPVFPFLMDPAIFVQQAVNIFVITLVIGLYMVRKVFALDIQEAVR